MNGVWTNLAIAACFAALVFTAITLLDRVVTPWRMKKRLEKIVRDVKAGKKTERAQPKYAIEFDSVGFSVRSIEDVKNSGTLSWAEVERVVVFKRDLWAYDLVCMFVSKPDETGFELDEEMSGWSEFTNSLPNHLVGCEPWEKWFMEVTFPAFETKLTEIFKRESEASRPKPTEPSFAT